MTRLVVPTLVIALSAACTTPSSEPGGDATVGSVTQAGMRDRLEDLAVATGSSVPYRAVGGEGYDRAAALVEEQLSAAGWTVEKDAYDATAYIDPGGSTLEVGGQRYGSEDVLPLVFAPAGVVEGPVVALNGAPGGPEESGVGCRSTDYGDLPAGALVLVPPGGCARRDQLAAARDAGAGALVTYSPGVADGLVLRPTLVLPDGMDIPAVWVSAGAAEALGSAAVVGGTARLDTRGRTERSATRSVLAELPGARDDAVVLLGAHLDSVLDGPGVNDDGSGVATLLEIARALGGTRHEATVRLAFWSGEELGLQGSTRYTSGLPPEELDTLLVYLNADMLASPNGFAGVYDEPSAAPGSAAVRDLLQAAVERGGATPVGVDLHRSSDHYAFSTVGVPTGGVFSGALEPVTPEQAQSAGATAGRPADPCYHQPCDDLDNPDLRLGVLLGTALLDVAVRLADDPGLLDGPS